jgi:hypothetical protein
MRDMGFYDRVLSVTHLERDALDERSFGLTDAPSLLPGIPVLDLSDISTRSFNLKQFAK